MDSFQDTINLAISSIVSSPRNHHCVPCSSITPQTSTCSQIDIQQLLEFCDEYNLYNNSITTQTGASNPGSTFSTITTFFSSTPTLLVASGPKTFPLFSQLPMEIRANVWRISSQEIDSRVISIEPDDEYEDTGTGFRCRAQAVLPSLFSTCSEARAEVLHFYQLKFHVQLRRPVYFNNDKDILLMNRTGSMFSFLQSTYDMERLTQDEFDRNEVRFLALLVNDAEVNFWGEDSLHGYPSWRQVSTAATTFPNLHQLRLVYQGGNHSYTPEFQEERATLKDFWARHWSRWQVLRARALQVTHNLVMGPRTNRTPEIVFWSREELGTHLPTMERWRPENFQRRSRGSPEPLYGRNRIAFFQGSV